MKIIPHKNKDPQIFLPAKAWKVNPWNLIHIQYVYAFEKSESTGASAIYKGISQLCYYNIDINKPSWSIATHMHAF